MNSTQKIKPTIWDLKKSLVIIESVRAGGRGQIGSSWRPRQTPARVADADAMRALLIAMAPQPYCEDRCAQGMCHEHEERGCLCGCAPYSEEHGCGCSGCMEVMRETDALTSGATQHATVWKRRSADEPRSLV